MVVRHFRVARQAQQAWQLIREEQQGLRRMPTDVQGDATGHGFSWENLFQKCIEPTNKSGIVVEEW